MFERIPLISLREYDFTDVSAARFVEVLAVKAFDLTRWRQASVDLRVHDKSIAAGTISVRVLPCSISIEQPQTLFVDNGSVVQLDITSADTPPFLISGDVAFAGACDFLRIFVRGTQTASPGALKATISVEALVKSRL